MADYYTQFSVVLDNIPEEDYPYLRGLVKRIDESEDVYDDELCFECQLNEKGGQLWIHSDETGEPSHAAKEIQKYLSDFQPEAAVELYWADTCSKPRPDGFSGGACLITAEEIFWFNPSQQVQYKLDELSVDLISGRD